MIMAIANHGKAEAASLTHEDFQTFVGVDLHKTTVTLTAVDPAGEFVARLTTSTKAGDIHRPAAVCDNVVKLSSTTDVVLSYYVIAYIATAFTLSGQKAHPIQFPVFSAVVAVIFDMIPHAECDLQQFVADLFSIMNGIAHTAKFQPPEIISLFEIM